MVARLGLLGYDLPPAKIGKSNHASFGGPILDPSELCKFNVNVVKTYRSVKHSFNSSATSSCTHTITSLQWQSINYAFKGQKDDSTNPRRR
jgi:hypothetical protein